MNLLEVNAEKLCEILRTSVDRGLSPRQVQLNRREFADETRHKRLGIVDIPRTIFGNVMLVLFLLLSFFALDTKGDYTALVSIVLMVISFIVFRVLSSSYVRKTEKKIQNYSRSFCRVIRDGETVEVEYSELVPGDMLLLEKGDVVPCDALVLTQTTLRVLEVQLTGNTTPVVKLTQEDVLSGKGCPYYECILFAGSVVISGTATALVCNVGNSIFDKKNKLANRVRSDNRPKVYEKAVTIANRVSLVWIVLSAITVILGIIKGENAFSLFYLVTTLSVAVLPDVVLTLSELNLASATRRLFKKGAVVKNLSAIDRMCDINCIAVDSSKYFRSSDPKPHTVIVGGEKKLFKNAEEKDVRELFEYACVACVGTDTGAGVYYNDINIEKSLLNTAKRLGIAQNTLYEKYLLLEKMPFTKENGMSRVIVFRDGRFFLVCLGISEYILRVCSAIRKNGIDKNFFEREKRILLEESRLVAADNEGMVAVCVKEISYHEGMGQIENPRGSTFLGFIGMHTSIVADSAKAVNICDKSGIDILLMTNESRATSVGFADSLFIMKPNEKVIDKREFSEIDEGLFRADIKKYKVFLSLGAEEREKVIKFRKSDGDIVATTASGIADIPLQLESDVAFCNEGVRDDTVVRNSDVVLTKGFDAVPECIKYARSVYRNIRHLLEFLMLTQFTLASCAFMMLLFLPQISFEPVQIVLFSTFVFMPLSFVLANEKVRGTELRAGFGEENVNINFQNLITVPLICGMTSGLVTSLCTRFALLSGESIESCRAVLFITLSFVTVFMAFSVSSDSTISTRLFKNHMLLVISPIVMLLSVLMVVVKPFARGIHMSQVNPSYMLISLAAAFIPWLLSAGIKIFKKYVIKNFK